MNMNRIYLPLIVLLLALGCPVSCTSTDIIDDTDMPGDSEKSLTVSFSAPVNEGTRANADHKLRFIATLIPGSFISHTHKREEAVRKEVVATEDDSSMTVTFTVPDGDYTIITFADYIPITSQADENGYYEDYYYNTHDATNAEIIHIKKIDLNNDNMDCFGAFKEIKKSSAESEFSVTLSRKVSKIVFVSTTGVSEGNTVESVTVSSYKYNEGMNLQAGKSGSQDGKTVTRAVTVSPLSSDFFEESGQPLFFFYTFADYNTDEKLGGVKFQVNFSTGDNKMTEISSGLIPYNRNSVTTVKGAFISDPVIPMDDLILHLSVPSDWGTINWENQ